MKYMIILLLAALQVYKAGAQTTVFPAQPHFETGEAEVSFNKTTMLLFPYAVKPGDIGSSDVIAQKVKGVENAVKVKAARRNFSPTNISIFTADGKLYSINLRYTDSIQQSVHVFGNGGSMPLAGDQPGAVVAYDQAALDSAAAGIFSHRGFISHPAAHTEKVRARVTGIYYAGGTVFIRLSVRNHSFIPYGIDFTRTAIETVARGKRKSQVSVPVKPTHTYGLEGEITRNSPREILLVYSKFTLSGDRRLVIRFYEQEGHRDFVLPIRAGTFSRARPATVN